MAATVSILNLLPGSSTPLLASGDVLAFVDISDATQSPGGSTVRATLTQFFAALPVPVAVTSASVTALAAGLNGATNPAFAVDASTALQVAGLKVTGAVTGGTVAIVATDSGAAANISLNAKGTGTIGIGSVSTGAVTITPATTIVGQVTLTAAFGAVTPPLIFAPATATAASYLKITSANVDHRIGAGDSLGNGPMTTGVSAYGLFVGTVNSTVLKLFTNNTLAITVSTGQVVTFANAIIGGSNTDITINTNKFTVAASSGNTLVAGTLAVTGIATFTTTQKNQSVTALQFDTGGTGLSVANNGTGTITLPIYCTVTISETSVGGSTAIFVVSNTTILLQFQTGSDFSITPGTGSSTNVTYAAGVLSIENKKGSTATYRVTTFGRGP